MIGRMYVNELTSSATAIDFSWWPGQILDKEKVAEGFAYHKVLELLGIRSEAVSDSRTMLLAGDTVAIKGRAPQLRRHIGLIARFGAEKELPMYRDGTRDQIGRHLGRLVDWLRVLPDDTPFVTVAKAVTAPFARDVNDPKELFEIIPGGRPWWFAPETPDEPRQIAINNFLATEAVVQESR